MEWPHRVGSLNFQVFSAKEPYFGWVLMQKKPRNLGSFLYVATPQCATHAATHCNTLQHNATCCCHHVVLCLVFDPAFCMCVSVCVCLRVCVCMCVSACSRNKWEYAAQFAKRTFSITMAQNQIFYWCCCIGTLHKRLLARVPSACMHTHQVEWVSRWVCMCVCAWERDSVCACVCARVCKCVYARLHLSIQVRTHQEAHLPTQPTHIRKNMPTYDMHSCACSTCNLLQTVDQRVKSCPPYLACTHPVSRTHIQMHTFCTFTKHLHTVAQHINILLQIYHELTSHTLPIWPLQCLLAIALSQQGLPLGRYMLPDKNLGTSIRQRRTRLCMSQCVAVSWSVLQCAAVCYIVLPLGSGIRGWVYCVLQCVAVCCSVSQCVIVHCHWAVAYAAVYFEVSMHVEWMGVQRYICEMCDASELVPHFRPTFSFSLSLHAGTHCPNQASSYSTPDTLCISPSDTPRQVRAG